ncbi:DUF2461 domain-containing protein [Ornithinimicrobium sp. LYQ121]|uniref:DUF2461 domain-containing protein n=1 Tax=Ornithinimicrobium sp. LYQ121 TaxID=3378801 RepID=UPI00385419AE
MTFTGFPHAATEFYAELERDNSTGFWQAHKDRWERDVRGPMVALMAGLEDEFGPAKIFRPNRDVRFSADKSPYKTHQGGYVGVSSRTGWYAEVSADGFRLGAGSYHLDPDALAAYRAGVDGPGGAELERIVDDLRAGGWEIGGERLRTAPRGWSRDHPRIELLRHRSLTAMRWIEDGDVVTTPALLEHVRGHWRAVRPLVEWLGRVVGT